MLPYGLGQKVKFEKNFGPKLGEVNLSEINKIDEINFVRKIRHVYKAIKKVSSDASLNNKNTIGFINSRVKHDWTRPATISILNVDPIACTDLSQYTRSRSRSDIGL